MRKEKCGSIVAAGRLPIALDGRSSCFFRAALFFLGAGDLCLFPLFGCDKGGSDQVFEAEPCNFPVSGKAAGFFGEDHDPAIRKHFQKPCPHLIGQGLCVQEIKRKTDAATGLVDVLSTGTGRRADEDFFQFIVPEEVHWVCPVLFCRGFRVCSFSFVRFLPVVPGRFSGSGGSP